MPGHSGTVAQSCCVAAMQSNNLVCCHCCIAHWRTPAHTTFLSHGCHLSCRATVHFCCHILLCSCHAKQQFGLLSLLHGSQTADNSCYQVIDYAACTVIQHLHMCYPHSGMAQWHSGTVLLSEMPQVALLSLRCSISYWKVFVTMQW